MCTDMCMCTDICRRKGKGILRPNRGHALHAAGDGRGMVAGDGRGMVAGDGRGMARLAGFVAGSRSVGP